MLTKGFYGSEIFIPFAFTVHLVKLVTKEIRTNPSTKCCKKLGKLEKVPVDAINCHGEIQRIPSIYTFTQWREKPSGEVVCAKGFEKILFTIHWFH